MKKVLKNKLYLKTLVADLISNFGDSLYYLALMTYVTEINNSDFALSIINISETLPILFTILFGFLADRTGNKIGMILKSLWIRVILYLSVAVVMNIKPSLFIVLFASVVNLISDTLGQFENGLFYPISNRLVKKSDREETMAFRQTVTSSLNIVYQSLGAFFIVIFSYSQLALINAFSFAVSWIIMLSLRRQLEVQYSHKTPDKEMKKFYFVAMFSEIVSDFKLSIHYLFRIKNMKHALFIIPMLNGSLAIVIPLVVASLSKTSVLTIVNSATTISLLGICTVIGSILGGFLVLTNKTFKKASVGRLLKMNLIVILALFVSFYFQNIYMILLFTLLSSVFVSSLNPKIGTLIFNHIDENKLATIFGGMVTYFQLGDILSKIMFSILLIYLPYVYIICIYMMLITLSILYMLRVENSVN